jgi:hypothetical protein
MADLGETSSPVRAILVAGEFSPRALAAARVVSNVELKKYEIKFSFEKM